MLTIAEALVRSAETHPENYQVYLDDVGNETRYSFVDIERETKHLAAGLQAQGLRKGDRVGLVLIDPQDFILTFYACLRTGIIAVPLYPPMSMADLDSYIEKLTRICTDADCKMLIASTRIHKVLWQVVSRVPGMKTLLDTEALGKHTSTFDAPEINPEEIAFLQYTSGSTSDPKGVMVTHANLYHNLYALTRKETLDLGPTDTAVSWLPQYHDMGLIGFVIAPMLIGMNAVFIPTMSFLKRPNRWLDAIHTYRGTATFCPPFALGLAARRARPAQLEKWDLSCLRFVGVGAEPIQPEGARQFAELFSEHCNLAKNAVLPAYGMAEATLGMSIKRVNDTMRTIHIDHDLFQAEKIVKIVEPSEESSEQVACGAVLPEHELSAFDEDGNQLPEGVEGELWFRGPSVAQGYWNNEEGTREAFRSDGWLRTGDLGFVLDKEVYVSGRVKDLIIINGRNIHPQSLEWPLYNLEGVRPGNVVAFSCRGRTTEEIILCIETRADAPEDLEQSVRNTIVRSFGVPVEKVVLLQAGQLPKTSSGKLQRRKTRAMYLSGELERNASRTMGSAATKTTVVKHVARSLIARVKNIAARA